MVIFHSFLYVYQRVYGCKLIHLIQYLVGGIPTPLKNMKVSWDDDIPNIWKNKSHVPNHQPVYYSKKELWDVVGILGPWHGHHY